MKNRLFAASLTILLSLANSNVASGFSGSGSGTQTSPFQVTSCAELQELNSAVGPGIYYRIQNDIDCNGFTFSPIARLSPWQAELDGSNFTISNLTIVSNGASGNNVGLIANMAGGAVERLNISDASITNPSSPGTTGIVVGLFTGGTIRGVSTSGSVQGWSIIGGVVGYFVGGSLTQSSSTATVSAQDSYGGGLVGLAIGTKPVVISDCYASGVVCPGAGFIHCGGLVGALYKNVTISNSYSSSSVGGTGNSVGGFAGANFIDGAPIISNSFAYGSVSGSNSVGGFLGTQNGLTLSNIFFDVTGTNQANCYAGGSLSGCTGVNVAGASPSYFLENNTNPPMSSWDFSTVWETNTSALPSLLPLPTLQPLVTRTPTNTPTTTPTRTATSTRTPTPTRTATTTPGPTNTPTNTPTPSDTPATTPTTTPAATSTPVLTQTPTSTATEVSTQTPTETATPELSSTPTAIALPTASFTKTPTATPTEIATQIQTNIEIPKSSSTPTMVPSNPAPTPTAVGSVSKDSPVPKVRLPSRSITLTIRGPNWRYSRNYFAYVVNAADNKIFKKKKIRTVKGKGSITIKNVPKGSYWIFTVTTRSREPKLISSEKKLVVIE